MAASLAIAIGMRAGPDQGGFQVLVGKHSHVVHVFSRLLNVWKISLDKHSEQVREI
jgi:hypothetical protein